MTDPPDTLVLAVEHHRAGRLAAAEAIYRAILAADPRQPDAANLLGLILRGRGDMAAALDHIGRAVMVRGDVADYRHQLGETLRLAGRLEEAAQSFEQALRLSPGLPRAERQLGLVRAAQGDNAAAIVLLQRAYERQPRDTELLATLGDLHLGDCQPVQAAQFYRQAVALGDRRPPLLSNFGLALTDIGEFAEALAIYRQPFPHNNLALTELLLGNFATGWQEYQWRLKVKGLDPLASAVTSPAWTGGDLAGRRILLYAEQGVGDVLQFVRYAPLVEARGGRVVLAVHPELRTLLAPLAELAPADGMVRVREHIALLSLPFVFGTDLATIPGGTPYLRADPAAAAAWAARIASIAAGRLKVGLVWAGSPAHRRDRDRSLPLAAFAPLAAIPDIAFFALQKGKAAADAADPPAGMALADLGTALGDFADTAAAVTALDLVITVDTSVAHLAGALGKPVWILLSHVPDWRWLLERRDSPWYPTARLFRQPARGDWAPAIAEVAAALDRLRMARQQEGGGDGGE
jgi:tetratricopeptide (TPR) repeat protein